MYLTRAVAPATRKVGFRPLKSRQSRTLATTRRLQNASICTHFNRKQHFNVGKRNWINAESRRFTTDATKSRARGRIIQRTMKLWEVILDEPYSVICVKRDELVEEIRREALESSSLDSADLAFICGQFIKYLAYYHAIGLATQSQQMYAATAQVLDVYRKLSLDPESLESISSDLAEWKTEIQKLKSQNPQESFRIIGKPPDPRSSCFIRFFDYLRKTSKRVTELNISGHRFWLRGFYEDAIADWRRAVEMLLRSAQKAPPGSADRTKRLGDTVDLYIVIASRLLHLGRYSAVALVMDDIAAIPSDLGTISASQLETIDGLKAILADCMNADKKAAPHEAQCFSAIVRSSLNAATDDNEKLIKKYSSIMGTDLDLSQTVAFASSTHSNPTMVFMDRFNQLNAEIEARQSSVGSDTALPEIPAALLLQRARLFLGSGLFMDAIRDAMAVKTRFPVLVEPAVLLSQIYSSAGLQGDAQKMSRLTGKLQFFQLLRRDMMRPDNVEQWIKFELNLPKVIEVQEANALVLANGGQSMVWLLERMISAVTSSRAMVIEKTPQETERINKVSLLLAGLHFNRAIVHTAGSDWSKASESVSEAKKLQVDLPQLKDLEHLIEKKVVPDYPTMKKLWHSLYSL